MLGKAGTTQVTLFLVQQQVLVGAIPIKKQKNKNATLLIDQSKKRIRKKKKIRSTKDDGLSISYAGCI